MLLYTSRTRREGPGPDENVVEGDYVDNDALVGISIHTLGLQPGARRAPPRLAERAHPETKLQLSPWGDGATVSQGEAPVLGDRPVRCSRFGATCHGTDGRGT